MLVHTQTLRDRTAKNKLVSRPDAQARGLRHYFTGEACGNGHVALRYTSDKTCVECKRIYTRSKRAARRCGGDLIEKPTKRPGWGKFLCGVAVKRGELESYARTGKLPYRIIEKSGLFAPGLDFEMADYCVREGMDGGRLLWGIYLRNHNVKVATIMPGFPRAVATLKDLFDAANENRKYFRDGRPVSVPSRQLRSVQAREPAVLPRPGATMLETRMAGPGVSELATVRR
jgi:hypothetical protein